MQPQRPTSSTPPWQPRFTIAWIMMVTLVLSVSASSVSYLVRGNGREGVLIFLLITLAGPLVLMMAVSGVHSLVQYVQRIRRKTQRKS